MRSKRWATTIAVACVAGLFVPAAASAGTDVRAAQLPASPFDSQTQFCTKHTPPAGNRNSSSPGITPTSINLTDMSLDAGILKRLGVVVSDFAGTFKAVIDEINESCGGINGRKLILKRALYNQLSPDLPGHVQAMCIKATEDQKAFAVFNIGAPQTQARCVSVLHKTIYVEAPAYASADDFKDSQGRIFSLYPSSDSVAETFIADGVAEGVFKGKQVTVLATTASGSIVASQVKEQYLDVFKRYGIDAQFELLPCTGSNCAQGIPTAVRRMQANGTDVIVPTHFISGTNGLGILFKELASQGSKATIAGPIVGQQMAEAVVASMLQQSGPAGMAWVDKNGWRAVGDVKIGEWRDPRVKATPFAKMCNEVVAKRLGTKVWSMVSETENGFWNATTQICAQVRSFARAVWSLGNNVTTPRMIVALKKTPRLDRRNSSAEPRDTLYYNGNDIKATRVTTLKLQYPCGSPLPRPSTPTACAVPLDSPLRFRAVKY